MFNISRKAIIERCKLKMTPSWLYFGGSSHFQFLRFGDPYLRHFACIINFIVAISSSTFGLHDGKDIRRGVEVRAGSLMLGSF